MTAALEIVFWVATLLVLQSWVFYPATIVLLARGRADPAERPPPATLPPVSVILPVFNGAHLLEGKLDNLRALDYPADLLEFVVVSDGSSDDTVAVAERLAADDPRIVVVPLETNQGKSSAQNAGFARASHGLFLLTDLEARFSPGSLAAMVAAAGDPGVGCVGATYVFGEQDWDANRTHGLYARLENAIRRAESRLGILITVIGSGMLVRRDGLRPLDPDTGDDFIIPLDMALAGRRTVCAISAQVQDIWPARGFAHELRVRRRITLRNHLGLMRRRGTLDPFRRPLLAFGLISHKLLRWWTPVLCALSLASALALASHPFYAVVAALELGLLAVAATGLLAARAGYALPVAGALGSLMWMNLGMLWGVVSFLSGARIKRYR